MPDSQDPVLAVAGTDVPMPDDEGDVLPGGEAAVAECLELFKSTFNTRWKTSILDRCVTFFQTVTGTTAGITSRTSPDLIAEFQRDMEHFDQLQGVPEMREVLRRWIKRFGKTVDGTEISEPQDVAGDAGASGEKDAMDVDVVDSAVDSMPRDPVPPRTSKKRQHPEDDEEGDMDGRDESDVRRTRSQTTREPFKYFPASQVVGGRQFSELKQKIRTQLAVFVDQQDDYWQPFQPDSKLWKNCDPALRKHVESLKIPSVPLQNLSLPDMLLHCLGRLDQSVPGTNAPPLDPAFEARIKPLLAAKDWDYFLKNAAGVGKTRLMFELLVRCFGIYLNFAHSQQTNPYGSRDTRTAYHLLKNRRRNIDGTDIVFVGDAARNKDARDNNETIVTHLYQLLIYARVLVLDWFLDLYKKRYGSIDAAAVRLWCLLQIRPLLRDSTPGREFDVFDAVFCSVLNVSMDSCSAATAALLKKKRNSKIPVSMTFLILDEVNEPSEVFKKGFNPANPAHAGTRPLLKAVLHAVRMPFEESRTRVLVAATAFNESVIRDAIGSSTLKSNGQAPRAFTEFGDYSEPTAIEKTLLHFFGPSFVSRITKVMRGHIDFWFTARRRFLLTYIQWVLHQGPSADSLLDVLGQLVDQATGKSYAGDYKPITGLSFPLIVPKTLTDKPVENATLIMKLQHAVVYFLIKGRFPSYAEDMRDMVTYGLGRFVPAPLANGREVVTIRESLTLASLMAWVHREHGETPLTTLLDMAMSTTNPTSRGFAFEDVVMFALWQAFADKEGTRLDKIFNFRYLPPAWKGKRAKLVQIFKRSSDNNRSHTLTPGVTTRIGYDAASPGDTLSWFCDAGVRKARIPFLQPDHKCGPDLMCVLLVDGVELLVCVQCKCWTTKHSPGELRPALIKLTPEGFYSDAEAKTILNEPARSALEKALREFKAPKGDEFMPRQVGSPEVIISYGLGFSHTENRRKAKLKLLRVLAVFDQSVSWPSFDASYGCYPIASLSREVIASTKLKFSAFEKAYQMASLRVREGESPAKIK